jgi:hypothetical protein
MIGLDVKAVRIQPAEIATQHLSHSMRVFLRLLALSRSSNREPVGERDGVGGDGVGRGTLQQDADAR